MLQLGRRATSAALVFSIIACSSARPVRVTGQTSAQNADAPNVSYAREGETPLMRAAEYGHVNDVALLLKRGAVVNAQDRMGRTALIDALSSLGEESKTPADYRFVP